MPPAFVRTGIAPHESPPTNMAFHPLESVIRQSLNKFPLFTKPFFANLVL
jgi:hypothetical protein